MKNFLNVIVPVFAVLVSGLFFNTLNAQASQTEQTVTASANIAAPLILTKNQDMNFGVIVANGGGTVVLDHDGERDATGEVEFLSGVTGTVQAATFTLKAHPQATVDLSFPGTVTLEDAGGNNSMSLSLTSSAGTSIDFSGFAGNETSFQMAGTLTVGDGQEEGDYSAEFDVTVSYQ